MVLIMICDVSGTDVTVILAKCEEVCVNALRRSMFITPLAIPEIRCTPLKAAWESQKF